MKAAINSEGIKWVASTDEGDGLLVEHSTGQQVEVVLHRIHDHRVTCVVAPLHETQTFGSFQGRFALQHWSNHKGKLVNNTSASGSGKGRHCPSPVGQVNAENRYFRYMSLNGCGAAGSCVATGGQSLT